jgi:hypothetical protein
MWGVALALEVALANGWSHGRRHRRYIEKRSAAMFGLKREALHRMGVNDELIEAMGSDPTVRARVETIFEEHHFKLEEHLRAMLSRDEYEALLDHAREAVRRNRGNAL